VKKIKRVTKSTTIVYLVFPDGERRNTVEGALEICKPNGWVREYTVTIKDIIVTYEKDKTEVAEGTYMSSKEIRAK